MAAIATCADDSILVFDRGMAQRAGRIDSIHDRVRGWGRGNFPAGARRIGSSIRTGYCGASSGWFAAAVMCAAAFVVVFRVAHGNSDLRSALIMFLLLVAVVPVFWLAYNAIIYRNPLEFANGPYSARAIEQRSARPGAPPHPGS